MYFPPEVTVNFLSDFCICYFKDTHFKQKSPPHYYINIPISDNAFLLLCIFTSQVENKRKYYSLFNEATLNSLVYLHEGDLPFLRKETVVDCNNPYLIRKIQVKEFVDEKQGLKIEMSSEKIPPILKNQVIDAIKRSPVVKPFIKKLIRY